MIKSRSLLNIDQRIVFSNAVNLTETWLHDKVNSSGSFLTVDNNFGAGRLRPLGCFKEGNFVRKDWLSFNRLLPCHEIITQKTIITCVHFILQSS